MEEQGIKIETSIWDNLLYEIWKNREGKEEIRFAGVDMGNRTYLVKWIDDKTFIAKTPSCNVLCGARGCGMVYPFPTKYILCKIDSTPLPCLLYTSDAADDLLCVDLGGRRFIKQKKHNI